MKRKLITILVSVLFLVVVLGGCTKSSSNQSAIQLGVYPWPGFMPWLIADQKGFFKARGVNVEIKYFPVYSDLITAQTAGKLDASGFTMSDLLLPLSKNIKMKAVMVHDNSNGGDALIVNEKFDSFEQLKGKKIATELGTVDHMLLLVGMQQKGLKENDVNFTNMSMNDAGPAFISGKLDGAVLYEPFVSQAVKEGNGKVLFSSADTPGLISDMFVFKEEITKNRPEDVKKMINAWYDALDFWKKNPDEAIAIMAKVAEQPADEFKKAYDGIKIFSMDDNLKAFKEGNDFTSLYYTAQKTGEFLKSFQLINDIPEYKSAIDSSFVEAVIADRKKEQNNK
jgi:NitT/TauT family transport system substrate-binding protein